MPEAADHRVVAPDRVAPLRPVEHEEHRDEQNAEPHREDEERRERLKRDPDPVHRSCLSVLTCRNARGHLRA